MQLNGKRVVVTGGGGFLGKHLVPLLKEQGVQEVIVPRSAQYDLRKEADAQRLFTEHPCDVVFHLASIQGGITYLQQHPGQILHDNLLINTHVLEAARRGGVQKFIAAGTALVYPKTAPMPLKEEDLWNGYPHEVTACYGLASRMLLAQAQQYRKEHGLSAIYVILCNLYGPHDHFFSEHPHVVPAMIKKFDTAAQEVVLFGTGEAAREFMHARDAARALIVAAQEYNSPEPLNIGMGTATPIRELAQRIAQASGFSGQVTWDTSKPEGEKLRCLDVSRMHKEISFRPSISLDEGLKETIAWYRAHKEGR